MSMRFVILWVWRGCVEGTCECFGIVGSCCMNCQSWCVWLLGTNLHILVLLRVILKLSKTFLETSGCQFSVSCEQFVSFLFETASLNVVKKSRSVIKRSGVVIQTVYKYFSLIDRWLQHFNDILMLNYSLLQRNNYYFFHKNGSDKGSHCNHSSNRWIFQIAYWQPKGLNLVIYLSMTADI